MNGTQESNVVVYVAHVCRLASHLAAEVCSTGTNLLSGVCSGYFLHPGLLRLFRLFLETLKPEIQCAKFRRYWGSLRLLFFFGGGGEGGAGGGFAIQEHGGMKA